MIQAALLIAGCDPSSDAYYVESWASEKKPPGYEAAKTAISNALRRGAITGRLVPLYEHDINGNTCGAIEESIDLSSSRIEVESPAMIEKHGYDFPTWDDRKPSAPAEVSAAERALEREVSKIVGAMRFVWLPVEDNPGPASKRGSIERNAIALLKSRHVSVDSNGIEFGIGGCESPQPTLDRFSQRPPSTFLNKSSPRNQHLTDYFNGLAFSYWEAYRRMLTDWYASGTEI